MDGRDGFGYHSSFFRWIGESICIADDISIFGEGKNLQQVKEDRDRRLVAVMERCNDKGTKINRDKFQFKLKEIKFMVNIITCAGINADLGKKAAITQKTSQKSNGTKIYWNSKLYLTIL